MTSNVGRGGRRYVPLAFTDLNSQKATDMSVFIVRAFVQLREMISTHRELLDRLTELESKVSGHDQAIGSLFEAIRQLMATPAKQGKFVGFRSKSTSD